MVTSEVLISPPDDREGNEEVDEDNPDGIKAFWKKMMNRFGNEDTYNKQLINLTSSSSSTSCSRGSTHLGILCST